MRDYNFAKDIEKHRQRVRMQFRAVYQGSVNHAFRSIRYGSAVTGAPGQPVDTGALLASWLLQFQSGWTAIMFSPLIYAPIIEDNHRGATLRSKVGGFHSVKLTRAGWQRVVRHENKAAQSRGGRGEASFAWVGGGGNSASATIGKAA